MNFTIQENIPLASLSTFGIGGLAKQFVSVDSPERLLEIIDWARKTNQPYKIFAGGSNIVFPDQGLNLILIRFLGGSISTNDTTIIVDAGVPLMDLIRASISMGLAGLETLSGIPGTVGGAVVGNAGAYGHSISEVVKRVEVVDGSERLWIDNSVCNFRYRHSIFKEKNFLLLRAELTFSPGDKQGLQKISQEIITVREKKYRPGLKCPGSFFKNVLTEELDPKILDWVDQSVIISGKIPAGYLLSEVSAKGMKHGDIEIADFHGNLFINTGNGTAQDVKELAVLLKQKVQDRFGIILEEEIRYF